MTKKISFIVCSLVVVVTNAIMMTAINNGEEVLSNSFCIVITLILFPGFMWAINNQKVLLIRVESSALLLLGILSIMRLINRIDELPAIANTSAVLIAAGMGIILIAVSVRRMEKK